MIQIDTAEFNFSEWRKQFRNRMQTLRDLVFFTLQDGGTVIEERGNGGRSEWRADGKGCEGRTFIQSAWNPEYITDHLMSRHEGFGWILEFSDGTRYELGKVKP